MNGPRRKRNIPLTIAALLLCLTLMSTWLVGGMYAKFATSDLAADTARAAKFVFVTGTSRSMDVSNMQPGDSRSLVFTVSNNHSEGSVSEVEETYALTIAVNGSMPLTLTLTDVTNGGNTQVSTVTRAFSSPNAATSDTRPSNVTLQASVRQGKTYELTAEWPEKDGNGELWSAELASGGSVASVTLRIDGVQVD